MTNSNERVVRSITVKTEKRPQDKQNTDHKQEITKQQKPTGPTNTVDIGSSSMSELDKIFSRSESVSKEGMEGLSGDVNKSVYGVQNAIEEQTELLRELTSSDEPGQLTEFEKKLSNKLTAEADIKNELEMVSSDESTVDIISRSVFEIEKKTAEQNKVISELSSDIKSLLGINEDSTSGAVAGDDINEELKRQGDQGKEEEKDRKKNKRQQDYDRTNSKKSGKIIQKTLGFIGNALSTVVKTLFRFSLMAAVAAVKWGAILFAIVFGFDVISKYMSYWFGLFDTSLKSLDTETSLLAPWLESLFNTFDDVKNYFINGEYWKAFKALFFGAFDTVTTGISMIATSIAKMVAGILRFFGASETADKIEASAVLDYAKVRNYRLSDNDIDVVSRVESTAQAELFKNARKGNWTDEEMTLEYQRLAGMDTNEVDQELLERLIELQNIYRRNGKDGLEVIAKDMVKTHNEVGLVTKRSEQYSDKESRLVEFLGEVEEMKADVRSTDSYKGSELLRQRDLAKILQLEKDINEKLELLRRPKEDIDSQRDTRPTKTIELISESQSTASSQKPQTIDNKIQNNQSITNNNSIAYVPVQTSRDVPGMYKSMEINA